MFTFAVFRSDPAEKITRWPLCNCPFLKLCHSVKHIPKTVTLLMKTLSEFYLIPERVLLRYWGLNRRALLPCTLSPRPCTFSPTLDHYYSNRSWLSALCQSPCKIKIIIATTLIHLADVMFPSSSSIFPWTIIVFSTSNSKTGMYIHTDDMFIVF